MTHIAWIHEGRLPLEEAGGKGAALSNLMAAGFQVPIGFCVVADGYRHFVQSAGLEGRIAELLETMDLEKPSSPRDVARQICDLVRETPMPQDLIREVAEAYDSLGAGVPACRGGGAASPLPGRAGPHRQVMSGTWLRRRR